VTVIVTTTSIPSYIQNVKGKLPFRIRVHFIKNQVQHNKGNVQKRTPSHYTESFV